jgi:CubicO group peptidase (beta-lactamase class C family)
MSPLESLAELQAYTQVQLEKHKIPALSLAVWQNGRLYQAAAGILNRNTGVEATTDAIFQIGSITKVFTTCLVMQLVDEGRVNLDIPVKQYLRDFQVADAKATQTITVRQLLNHTSGMAGDFIPDDRHHQGNLIARYADRCSLLPVIHPVGEMFSYSNSAFCIAGRLIEVMRGMSWYQAMEDYIFKPLGMKHAIADPKEVIRYRAAMGHIFDGNNTDQWVLPEQTYLPLGTAPSGATSTMSAGDLITFARAHLNNGLSQSGDIWLSAESIKAMQTPQIEQPRLSLVRRKFAGLGWGLTEYTQSGLRLFGHAGATLGFFSIFQVIPEQNSAYAILMNGFKPMALEAINRDLLQALSGLECQEPEVMDTKPDSELFNGLVGKYESFDTLIDVTLTEGKLKACVIYKIDPMPPLRMELKHVKDGCFAAFTEEGQRCPNLAFLQENEAGIPQYLFNGGRLNNRVL